MSLALVFPEASRRGGVERVVWDVADYFGSRTSVEFVGCSAPDGLPQGVSFLRVPASRLVPTAFRAVEFRAAAARELRRSEASLRVSHGVESPPGDVLWVQSVHRAWLRASSGIVVRGIPVPARTRYLRPYHALTLTLERSYFRATRARRIICTSQREVDDLVELYGIDARLASVVPNWFDPNLFNLRRRRTDGGAARHEMGVIEGEITVLFVANELHRKGFGELLAALAASGDERLTMHVIGRASPAAYQRRINELGLSRRVRYHGPTNDAGFWYAGADLLALPTHYEPFGIVIIEALASGVPVVTTRLAGAAPAVEHGVSGLIQEDPHDVDELTALIQQAARADLKAWGTHAAASVDGYRRDHVLARVEQILVST
jgi:UDP-glucose:(heptosyl)LPS alpha-1,3-glucosyltransferase